MLKKFKPLGKTPMMNSQRSPRPTPTPRMKILQTTRLRTSMKKSWNSTQPLQAEIMACRKFHASIWTSCARSKSCLWTTRTMTTLSVETTRLLLSSSISNLKPSSKWINDQRRKIGNPFGKLQSSIACINFPVNAPFIAMEVVP